MAIKKYCRVRCKNVEIDEGPFTYTCTDIYPTSDACEQAKCVYHNVMGMASAIAGVVGGGLTTSRDDFIRIAVSRFGAINYCDDAR